MNPKTLERYKNQLLDMRLRLVDEVEHLLEEVPDDLHAAGSLSRVPTHPADYATEGSDKEIRLISNEQGLQAAVHDALARIEAGTFGRCQECGGEISEERLQAIPYASYCIGCAAHLETP